MDILVGVLEDINLESLHLTEAFTLEVASLIWSSTTPGYALRRAVVDYYLWMVDHDTVESAISSYHPEFTKDLLMGSLRTKARAGKGNPPSDLNGCCYHEHDEQHPQYEEASSENEA